MSCNISKEMEGLLEVFSDTWSNHDVLKSVDLELSESTFPHNCPYDVGEVVQFSFL